MTIANILEVLFGGGTLAALLQFIGKGVDARRKRISLRLAAPEAAIDRTLERTQQLTLIQDNTLHAAERARVAAEARAEAAEAREQALREQIDQLEAELDDLRARLEHTRDQVIRLREHLPPGTDEGTTA